MIYVDFFCLKTETFKMDVLLIFWKDAMFSKKDALKPILIFILIFVFVVAAGCGKKNKETKGTDKVRAQTEKKPSIKVTMTPVKTNQIPQKSSNRFPAFIKGTEHLEKYDSKPESCKTFCTIWCPLAAKCGMPVMHKPPACKKICYDPCTKGLLTKRFGDCIMKAKDCPHVKECFSALRSVIEKAHKKKANTK